MDPCLELSNYNFMAVNDSNFKHIFPQNVAVNVMIPVDSKRKTNTNIKGTKPLI
jgi:hypothetical protein